LHNFDSYYYQSMRKSFGYRDLMIVDECHALEGKFLDFMQFTISNKKRPIVIPQFETAEEYSLFLEKYKEELYVRIRDLSSMKDKSPRVVFLLDELNDILRRISMFFSYLKIGTEYVVTYNDYGSHQSVLFQPVMVLQFAQRFFGRGAKRVLMMSATVLSDKMFCETIGIPPSDAEFVRIPSTFPVENRPIFLSFVGKLTAKSFEVNAPKMIDGLKTILAGHPGVRGIIHTHSDKILKYIRENMDDPRLTYQKDYKTFEEFMAAHVAKVDSFIVASGLREGLDLHGDLSRVQVLCKIPYPNMHDRRVKRRMQISPMWLTYQAALMFVQSIGRSVRSSEDNAVTYVLDSDFTGFYNRGGKYLLPDYIKRALRGGRG